MPPVRGVHVTWDHHIAVINTYLDYWGVGMLLGLVSSVFVNTWCNCGMMQADDLNTPQNQVVGFFALFQMCGVMVSGSDESTPSIIYHCVLRGLERLLLSEQLSRLDSESLVKLSVDRVNVQSPHRAMAALGLMLTCMYTGIHFFVLLMCWETGLLAVLVFVVYFCYQEWKKCVVTYTVNL